MKYIPHILCLFVLAVLFLPAGASMAYTTTGQEAFTVDGHTGVFRIDFAFGHGKYDVSIPLHAVRGTEGSSDHISYEIHSERGEPTGTTMGIILSDAPLRDGMYVVPKGKKMSFTLLTFFTPEVTSEADYRLKVTDLPFLFDNSQKLGLNPSELEYYQTDSETLRK